VCKLFNVVFLQVLAGWSFTQETTTTVSSGNWSASSNWDNGAPGVNDTAIVNHSITFNVNDNLAKLIVNGTLTNTSKRLRIRNEFRVNGLYSESGTGYTEFPGAGPDKHIFGEIYFNNLVLNTNDDVFTHDSIWIKDLLNLTDGTLDVSGGVLTLLNNATYDGRIGRSQNGLITGNFIWEKWIDRCNGWSTYGAPFSATFDEISTSENMIFTGFPGSDFPAFWQNTYLFSESSGWLAPSGMSATLARGKGYFYYNSDSVFYSASSSIPQQWKISLEGSMDLGSTFNFNVTYTSASLPDNIGWNLISNPFPGTISWNVAGWTKTNVNNAIYTFNTCSQVYASYVGGIGTNGGSQWISSGQGFWVRTSAASPSLRCTQNVIRDNSEALKGALTHQILKLSLGEDEIAIRLTKDATREFDSELDAEKIVGIGSKVYSVYDENEYSIQSVPDSAQVIPLMTLGGGTINANCFSLDAYEVLLEDLKANTLINLKTSPVVSFSENDTAWIHRFNLLLLPADPKESTPGALPFKISYSENFAVVNLVDESVVNASLYALTGALIWKDSGMMNVVLVPRHSQMTLLRIELQDGEYVARIGPL